MKRARKHRAVAVPPILPSSFTDRSLEIVYWPLDRLAPYARNARTHSEAQVAEIAGSIASFGFVNPILVAESGEIIAGHGRLAAAKLLGLSQAPVIRLEGLTDVQRRQLTLADNRIAMNAGWDLEMLQHELQDIRALGADLTSLGFTDAELSAALTGDPTSGLTDEDDTPDIEDEVVSRLGDIWHLGDHRIACGDSTDADLVTLRTSAPTSGRTRLLERAESGHSRRPRLRQSQKPSPVAYAS